MDVIVDNDINVLIKVADRNNTILPEVTLNEKLKAPLKQGDVVGKVKYTVEGIEYEEPLLASNNVKKSHWFIKLLLFSFFIFICFMYFDYKKRIRKRNNLKRKVR